MIILPEDKNIMELLSAEQAKQTEQAEQAEQADDGKTTHRTTTVTDTVTDTGYNPPISPQGDDGRPLRPS